MKLGRSLILDTILLGVVGAPSAQVFMLLLRAFTTVFLTHPAGYQAPVLPNEEGPGDRVIGGLGVGLLSPVGSGIPVDLPGGERRELRT